MVRPIRIGNPGRNDGNCGLRASFTRFAVNIDGFRLPYTLFHFLAWLECHDVFRLDVDGFAGSRVPCFTRLTLADFKYAEFPKFNPAIGR